MEYKVKYIIYSNMEWQHWDEEEVVKASSKEEAKQIIENRSNGGYEFLVKRVEEVK